MRTKNLPFQLEQTVPGAFLLQGFAGGAITGYLFTVFLVLIEPHPYSLELVVYIPFVMVFGGVLGMLKAIPLWAMYRLTGIRMIAPVRIVASTVISTSLVLLLFYLVSEIDRYIVRGTAVISFLIWLPAALLVGSRVKPWDFLVFWSIAVQQHGFTKRLQSSSVPAVLGVLPLRLLSTLALAFWIFATAAIWPAAEVGVTQGILFGLLPIAYFALSTYLTFSSPRKPVLLALGVLANLSITYLSFFGHHTKPNLDWTNYTIFVLQILCPIFLAAWTTFLATRFLVDVNDFLPSRAFINLLKQHRCLGSRFTEWQERAA